MKFNHKKSGSFFQTKVSATFLFFALLQITSTQAQEKGQLPDSLSFVISKEFQAVLPDPKKITGTPDQVETSSEPVQLSYEIVSKKINVFYEPDKIAAPRMQGEPSSQISNGYIKLGMGTYTSPMAELSLANLRSKKYAFGVYLKHLSSTGQISNVGNSSFSDNNASVFGKIFFEKYSLNANLDYTRNVVHFYGYNVSDTSLSKNDIKQRFSVFDISTQLTSTSIRRESILDNLKLKFYNYNDKFGSSENNIGFGGRIIKSFALDTISINAGIDYYNNKASNNADRDNVIINLSPAYNLVQKNWSVLMGGTAAFDVSDTNSSSHIYPLLELKINIVENILKFYAGLNGGIVRNSFRSLSTENQFVLSDILLVNSNRKYSIYGGLKGGITSNMTFKVHVAQSSINRMPLFVNDTAQAPFNRFLVIYDNGDILNANAEIGYQFSNIVNVIFKGDFYNVNMVNEQKAWFFPTLRFTLTTVYNISEKVKIKFDFMSLNEQYAKVYTRVGPNPDDIMPEAIKLKGIYDFNLGGEYRHNKKLSGFVSFNNIANMRYYRWHKYPNQRFNLMAGVSYAF